MNCRHCGKPTSGDVCDGCSGDPVKQAFARKRPITPDELRALIKPKGGRRHGSPKYNNVPTVVDGIRFASKREAKRYGELKLALQAGAIRDLRRQVRYPLTVSGVERTTTYIADFVYEDVATGETVVEDAKGFKTKEYILKAKMVLAQYGITIREV